MPSAREVQDILQRRIGGVQGVTVKKGLGGLGWTVRVAGDLSEEQADSVCGQIRFAFMTDVPSAFQVFVEGYDSAGRQYWDTRLDIKTLL